MFKSAVILMVFLVSNVANAFLTSDPFEARKTAVESISQCGNFIRYDEKNVYTGYGLYGNDFPRKARPASVEYVSLHDQRNYRFETLDSVVDLLSYKGSVFVLTYSGIEEWNLDSHQRVGFYPTSSTRDGKDEHTKAFDRYGDKLILAHGRQGVSFFDLTTKKITRTLAIASHQLPLESTVNGVTVSGDLAIVTVDSFSMTGPQEKPAFQGFAVIDLKTEQIVSEMDGLPPGPSDITSDQNVVVISFYGVPLWKYATRDFTSARKLPSTTRRVSEFPLEGSPTGKASMDKKYFYTCFHRLPKEDEGSRYIRMPVAFERKSIHLD